MARFRVDINRHNVGALLTDRGMRRVLENVAERGVAFARSIAPDRPPLGKGYVAGLHATSGIGDTGAHARIEARDRKSVWIEYGTQGDSPTPAFHVLARTVDHLEAGTDE